MRIRASRVRGSRIGSDGRRTAPGDALNFDAIFAPGESSEDHDHRDTTETKATLYVRGRVELDVIDKDRVLTTRPRVAQWQVDGDPQPWESPFTGRPQGIVINMVEQRG